MPQAKSGSALASKEDHVPDQDNIQAEEEETFFQDVDELQKFGINVADLTKLKQSGICTIKGVQMCTRKTLLAIKGISEAKVDKIKEASAKLVEAGFITAMDFAIKRDKVMRISTGSAELDKLLGGGIETQSITEAFGEFRTGKTQLCHTLCVTTQLPTSMGGANGKVAYIDTEGTFRPERLRQISERFNIDADAVLENVIFTRVYNSDTQMDALTILAAKFHEEGGVYRLIIVDSIIALFRVDYSGRGELSERQQKLNQMLSRLIKLAEEWNCAVFITNQMTADPAGGMTFVADPKKPVGGNILAHASTTRLSLRKGRGEQRICKIYDSPNLPESEAVFQIGAGGITDAKD